MLDERLIDVTDAELHTLADDALAKIIAANDPPLTFVRGRDLVYVATDGHGGSALEPYSRTTLRDLMSRTAMWRKSSTNKNGETKYTAVKPDADAADTILAFDPSRYDGIGAVDRVVDVPVFAQDGTLLTTPGFHEAARVYYAPAPGLDELRPVTGSRDDLKEALAWVKDELFADFPFVEDADYAHALTLFLLPFARDLIDGLTPMYPVIAPTPGSGKDSLVDVALWASCGHVPKTAEIKSDEEMRKQITSHLLAGTSALVFDNIKTTLDSGSLAAALTASVWRDRVLGASKSVVLPIRNVWALTANNLQTTEEQARRMAPIFLDAGVERPEARPFKRDLETWMPANRVNAVWAALTIIQAWLNADDPLVREQLDATYISDTGTFAPLHGTRLKGSYNAWARVMGGILDWCQVPGFLDNCDKMFLYADDTDSEVAAFWGVWATSIEEPYSTAQLVDLFWSLAWEVHLPSKLRDARPDQRGNVLGQVLKDNQNKVLGSYKLVKFDGRPRRWQVIKVV